MRTLLEINISVVPPSAANHSTYAVLRRAPLRFTAAALTKFSKATPPLFRVRKKLSQIFVNHTAICTFIIAPTLLTGYHLQHYISQIQWACIACFLTPFSTLRKSCFYRFYPKPRTRTFFEPTFLYSYYIPHIFITSKPLDIFNHSSFISHQLCASFPFFSLYTFRSFMANSVNTCSQRAFYNSFKQLIFRFRTSCPVARHHLQMYFFQLLTFFHRA